jgi:hypothetical protein
MAMKIGLARILILTVAIMLLGLGLPSRAEEENENSMGKATAEHDGVNPEKPESKKGEPSNFGPNKGVTEADEKYGIKLSPKAVASLGIETEVLNSKNIHMIPSSGLVYFQSEVGVYRERDGWFKLIEGHVIKRSGSNVTFEAAGLMPNDKVAIKGAALLRLTDLNVWSGSGDGDAD